MTLARVTPALAWLVLGGFFLVGLAGCGNPHVTGGKIAVQQQDWEGAVEKLQQAVETVPDNFEAHYYLAWSLAELERYQEAAVHFEEARELDPMKKDLVDQRQQHYWSGLYNAGVQELRDEDFFDAIDHFDLAAEIWPEDPRAYRELGYAYSRLQGDTDAERSTNLSESIASYHRAVSLDSTHVDTWLNLALSYRRAERLDDALDAFQQALAHNPNDEQRGEAHSRMGDIHFVRRDYKSAQVEYKMALEFVPEDAQIWYQLGVTCYNLEDYSGSVNAFESAIQFSEGQDQDIFEDATYNLGLAALQTEEYERALDAAETLLAVNPQEGPYYLLRGRARRKIAQQLEAQGKSAEAQLLTEESLEDFKKSEELGGD